MRLPAAALLLALLLPAAPARAGESFDNCNFFIDSLPAVVTQQGVWCLRHDVNAVLATGKLVTVLANNVTIDCNRYKIGNLGAGTGTLATGIGTETTRSNIVVRNCNLRGLLTAISLSGNGHVVEDNRIEAAYTTAISVGGGIGSFGVIRRNALVDIGLPANGGTDAIFTVGDIDILDNSINYVTLSDFGTARAISALFNLQGTIAGNRIRGLTSVSAGGGAGTPTLVGIDITGSPGRALIRDNQLSVQTAGTGDFIGIRCGSGNPTRGNTVLGFDTGRSGCGTSVDDLIEP